MRGLEIQLRTRSKVRPTREGQALTFGFRLGPVHVFVIANMPEPNGNEEGPLVYIKLNLSTDEGWQILKEHSTESLGKR